MGQLKFDRNGVFIPQKMKFIIKHDILDEEMINEYVNNECNLQIEYNKRGAPYFIKKKKL